MFNDSALGTTTVNVTTTVTPNSITMTNNSLNYTLVGSGSIAGSIGLNKQGSATLSVLNNNSYTGPTVISGRDGKRDKSRQWRSAQSDRHLFGESNKHGVRWQQIKLRGIRPVSVNRGYIVTADGSSIETVSNLTLSGVARGPSGTIFNKSGLGQLTYTAVTSSNSAFRH